MNVGRTLLLLCLGAPAALLPGCGATPRPATALPIPAGRYAEAFDAARESLRDLRFDLERVDARLGVITSKPHATDGLATPWDLEQTTTRQEVEDLAHEQRRRVRISFVSPVDAAKTPPPPEKAAAAPLQDAPAPRDLVDQRGGLTMRVEVSVLRTQRPGWRINANSVRGSSFSYDPTRAPGAEEAEYETLVGEDQDLAGRLVERVRAALSLPRPRRPLPPSTKRAVPVKSQTPPPLAP